MDNDQDCADGNPAIHPGAAEAPDGVDRDCDGVVDDCAQGWLDRWVDVDGDGVARWATVCGEPAVAFDSGGDCDDGDPAVGWSPDCVYATIAHGPGPAAFGRDVAIADVDGDGVNDGVLLWPQERRHTATGAVSVIHGPVGPGFSTRDDLVDTVVDGVDVGQRFAVADFYEQGRATAVLSSVPTPTGFALAVDPLEGTATVLDFESFLQVAVGHLDGDGVRNDLATVTSSPWINPDGQDVDVVSFHGGAATYLGRLESEPQVDTVTLFDLDGDGVDEVVMSVASAPAEILWSPAPGGVVPIEELASGSWQAPPDVSSVSGLVPGGDQDGDGYAELMIVPRRAGEIWVMAGGAAPSFGEWVAVLRSDSPLLGQGLTPGEDLDRDGHADLWLGGDPPPPPLFGPLSGTIDVDGEPTGTQAALGDADGDGRLDLWVPAAASAPPDDQVLVYLGSPDW